MNELQVFKNSEFGELGVLQIEGKEYFPATACAKLLGYKEPKHAIKRHCTEDGCVKRTLGVQTGFKADGTPAMQNIQTKFISEGNLFRLIVNSKLPTAEKFERWVFDEVLPTIRKTGSYGNLDIVEIIKQVTAETMKQLIPAIATVMSEVSNKGYVVKETAMYDDKITRCRRHTRSIISALDPIIRNEVEKMLIMSDKFTYSDIVGFLSECGVSVSIASVSRYSQTLNG